MEIFLGAFQSDWEQRRAAILHERQLGKRRPEEDEVRRRSVGGGEAGLNGRGRGMARLGSGLVGTAARRSSSTEPTMRSRFRALASGSQPAVVKLASFGGGGRLGAMISYVSRSGEVAVENDRGEQVLGRNAASIVQVEWDHLMSNRAESRDIGTFSATIDAAIWTGVDRRETARAVLSQALGDRGFVFAVNDDPKSGSLMVNGVTVLRDGNGERLTADRKATAIVQARIDKDQDLAGRVKFRFTGHGNGADYGAARVRSLVERHPGDVRTQAGTPVADAKQAGDLVQLDWRAQLHSRKARDVMHLVISARAGTDIQSFHAAARDFLAEQFAGHRYVFSLHDPAADPKPEAAGGKRPHVHAHAIVAMKSDAGDRIETSIRSFRAWRVTMAEKARAHGIDMEMTDRRDRASAPAYSRTQARPTNRTGRTEHEGTSQSAARRYYAKRHDDASLPNTKDSLNYSLQAREEWRILSRESVADANLKHAETQMNRLLDAGLTKAADRSAPPSVEDLNSPYRTNMIKLVKLVSEAEDMRQMTREEFQVYEKQVETALFRAEQIMPESEKANFEEIASAARDHVDARRDLMENAQRDQDVNAGRERDDNEDANKQWDRAVARHGLQAVEAANQIMLQVEFSREQIDRAVADDIGGDNSRLEAGLNFELARAGELGAAGNGMIREIAESDRELRFAVEAAERAREREARFKPDARDAIVEPDQDPRALDRKDRAAEDRSADDSQRNVESQLPEGEMPAGDRSATLGDTTRSSPALQHVPRIEPLQQEANEAREREDRDR